MVDDEPLICKISTEILLRRGYAVDIITDGNLAWQALKSTRYDLLVTDQNMPGLSGLELIRMARNAHMTLPVILFSGMPSPDLPRLERSLQINAVLHKPFTIDELVGMVEAALLNAARAAVHDDTAGTTAPPDSADTMPATMIPPPKPGAPRNISKR